MWQQRWQHIVQQLKVVNDAAAEQGLIDHLSAVEHSTVLGFVNAHAMNMIASNHRYHQALAGADVLLRDGSGMAILYRRLGLEPGLNMNGTDLIPKLLAAYQGRRVAFWGTQDQVLAKAVGRSERQFGVRVVSAHHGFAEAQTYLALARQFQPELVILGMGMPKQEIIAAQLSAQGSPCLIVCGGAILDFLGDKVTRAPQWMRRLGCEWLFRLLSEPKRLFVRYVLGNPAFILRSLIFSRKA